MKSIIIITSLFITTICNSQSNYFNKKGMSEYGFALAGNYSKQTEAETFIVGANIEIGRYFSPNFVLGLASDFSYQNQVKQGEDLLLTEVGPYAKFYTGTIFFVSFHLLKSFGYQQALDNYGKKQRISLSGYSLAPGCGLEFNLTQMVALQTSVQYQMKEMNLEQSPYKITEKMEQIYFKMGFVITL